MRQTKPFFRLPMPGLLTGGRVRRGWLAGTVALARMSVGDGDGWIAAGSVGAAPAGEIPE